MFALSERQTEEFKYYTFAAEEGTMMEVVPERGGLVSRLRVRGQDIFYLDEATLIDTNKNVRGGNPILFPICGPSSKGFRQHGFARNYPWKVLGTGVGADQAWITLEFVQQDKSFAIYPYYFKLEFKYILTNSGLRIEQCYKNTGSNDLPFHAGFHPYFIATQKDKLKLGLKTDAVFDLVNDRVTDFEGQLNYDDSHEYNYVFGPLAQQECVFTGHNGDVSIRLSYDQPFKYVVFWTLPDRPFICVEPWMAGNRSFETGEDLQWLRPQMELCTVVEYSLLP